MRRGTVHCIHQSSCCDACGLPGHTTHNSSYPAKSLKSRLKYDIQPQFHRRSSHKLLHNYYYTYKSFPHFQTAKRREAFFCLYRPSPHLDMTQNVNAPFGQKVLLKYRKPAKVQQQQRAAERKQLVDCKVLLLRTIPGIRRIRHDGSRRWVLPF